MTIDNKYNIGDRVRAHVEGGNTVPTNLVGIICAIVVAKGIDRPLYKVTCESSDNGYMLITNRPVCVDETEIIEVLSSSSPKDSHASATNVFGKSQKPNSLVGKSVDDVMICPKCGSNNCFEYSTDEIEFSYDNTGHYFVNCRCKDCDKGFILYTRFKYELTDTHT